MLNNNKIINLINKNKWDEILKYIKEGKIDKKKEIINGKNIAHISAMNNNKNIINYLLEKDSNLLAKIDREGNSCLHIMASNGYNDILKKTLKKNNEWINLVNNNGESVGLLCSNDGNLFNWIIKNVKGVDYNLTNKNKMTSFLRMISLSKKKNDIFYKNIDNILKEGLSLDIPRADPPLFYASRKGKSHIVDRLLKVDNINIDIYNDKYMTPFIISIYTRNYDISKKLVDNGANINYIGGMGEFNTFIQCAMAKDYKMIDYFLEKDFDFNKQNKFLDTSLHQVLLLTDFSLEYLYKIINRSNLNIQNIDGATPLHLILEKKDWENFSSILRKKDMDIFKKNNVNEYPTYYLKEDISKFYNILTESYMSKIDKKISKEICNSSVNLRCKDIIKNKILREKQSIPISKKENKNIIRKIKFIKKKNKNTVTFNSDTLHNVIYTMCLLKKYKNLMVPYQHYYIDKYNNDMDILQDNSIYRIADGEIIQDLVYAYHTILYELSPYIIVWRSIDKYYIHPDLEISIKKCLQKKEIRFIFMRITIIPMHDDIASGHANILVFDKKKGILDRFEPHGNIPFLEIEKLDELLKNRIGNILSDYLKEKSLKLEYINPSDYKNDIGVQTISNEYELYVKKLGDPDGFCLSWIYWYLETRLNNPDVHPIELLKDTYNKIIDDNLLINKKLKDKNKGDYTFINYIRNYASSLDDMKNNLLKNSGIDKNNYYNLIVRPKDKKRLINKLGKILNKKLSNI